MSASYCIILLFENENGLNDDAGYNSIDYDPANVSHDHIHDFLDFLQVNNRIRNRQANIWRGVEA